MTKTIRVENADTSNHPVRVTVQDKTSDGWVDSSVQQLDYPTAMYQGYIHATRRIVIEELAAEKPKQ